jgi:hypothetical protein
MVFYHNKECPDLNTKFFISDSHKIKSIPKTLIITGGSRNGNHLVWSLLDGNTKIPYVPGEDRLLSQVFIRNLHSPRKFLRELKSKKDSFVRQLSGMKFDKWDVLNKKKFNLSKWAGKHSQKYIPILEFPDTIHEINYNGYKKVTINAFKKIKDINFYQIFNMYLKAVKKLAPNKKNTEFKFIYAQSGLRREILYLLNHKANFTFLVPIRKFETFYFSKIKGLYNSTEINKKFIKEAWEHWYHKTNDYLYLKKKFPKNIILINFEDLENISRRKETLKKIFKKINIRYQKINLTPTIYDKAVLPNSSFFVRRRNNINFQYLKNKLKFPKNKIPKKYFSVMSEVNKFTY